MGGQEEPKSKSKIKSVDLLYGVSSCKFALASFIYVRKY
jgi:hypothetical protein